MTKRNSKGPKRSYSKKRSDKVINRAKRLLDDGLFDEAVNLLNHHADRNPTDVDVVEFWMNLIYEDGDRMEIWDVARRLYKIDPTNMEYILGMVNACMQALMPFTALQIIETHAEELRVNHDYQVEFEKYYGLLMEVRDQMMEKLQDKAGMTTAYVASIEELRSLYHIRAFDQAQALATRLHDDFPDLAFLYTTMSDGSAIQGDFAEAARLAQVAYDHDPSDMGALSNLIVYSYRNGRLDDMSAHFDILGAKTEFENAFELSLALETWAWLGDDGRVIHLYEQHSHLPDLEHSSMAHHLSAASYAFLGDGKQAKKLWRKVRKLNPEMEIAQENLDDLNLPVGQRHGPWHFQPTEWVPTEWIERVFKLLGTRSEQQAERNLRKFYDNTPALQFILPHIFERGSEMIVEFVLQIAATMKLPILAEFAKGQRGSDDLRLLAANMAAQNGLLPRGKPIQVYIKGELDDVILMAYRLHGEPVGKRPPRAIRNIMEDAHNLIQRERYDSALTLVNDGLEKAPDDPTLLNYLATIHRAKGERMEEEAVIRHTFDVHPNYFFGRCSMMELYAREGNFEAADALLEPMLERESFHFSEFGIFCRAHVALMTAKGDFKSAHSWLDMWERINPELVEIKRIRREVNIAERDARTASE